MDRQRSRMFGSGQSGRGQYGYGGSGGSTYGAAGYGPYSGDAGGREDDADRPSADRRGPRSREAPAEYRGDVRYRRVFRRGPKGYQRSDERLREDISERLMQAMHVDSSEVTVSVADGKATLEGTVPERCMKHAIEDLVDACPGVQDIDNRVRVRRGGEGSAG